MRLFLTKYRNGFIKTLSVILTLAVIFTLTLNMPIIAYTDKRSGETSKVSLIGLFKHWQPLIEIEGELENIKISDVIPEHEEQKINDGLDLTQAIEGQYTILFMGFDETGANSDVNWLFQFDILNGTLNVLQIPRDTFMPDYTSAAGRKFNSIYALGNKEKSPIQRVVDAIYDSFGIPVDSYVTMQCSDIVKIVDLVGGIPMKLDQSIMYEGDKIIPKGDIILNGQQAEWFVRYRRTFNEGDIGRVKNQRKFLAAAMQKMLDISKNEGTFKVFGYMKEIYNNQYILTNISIGELSMLTELGSTLEMENVNVFLLPGEGYNYYPPEHTQYQSVWSVHKNEALRMINEHFRPYQVDLSPENSTMTEAVTDHTNTYNDNATGNLKEIVGK